MADYSAFAAGGEGGAHVARSGLDRGGHCRRETTLLGGLSFGAVK